MTTPPCNNGAADAFATREPVDGTALALAAFDGLTLDNAFEDATLTAAATLARAARAPKRKRGADGETIEDPRAAALESLLLRVRALLGPRFSAWEREVMTLAALSPRDKRTRIVRGDDAGVFVRAMLRAIAAHHIEAGLFRRADVLGIVSDDGTARFKRIPHETVAARADDVLAVFDERRDRDSGRLEVSRVRATSLRAEFAALVGGDLSAVPELQGFALGAVLRPDGTVFDGEGFDAATGYLARGGARAPLSEPTRANARAALLALLSPFVDFPFDGAPVGRRATADELAANPHAVGMVAAIITAVCRSAFSGPAPAFLIEANTRGAGKSLIAHAVGVIATGASVAASTLADDEAERRKAIMAKMLEGEAVIALDNAKGTLGGPALESALTSEWFSDRLLGQTNTVRARNNALWLLTGNNCSVTSDLARRVQPVRLSYPAERPEDRDASAYAIPDLKGWVIENRAALWAHAVTLVRAFIVAGRPKPARTVAGYGSFEGWDTTIRHALLFVGAADPNVARQEFRERADIERDSTADLLRCLRDLSTTRHNGGAMLAADILRACTDATGQETEVLRALRDVGMRGGMPSQRSIGKALSGIRDTVCDGMRLEGCPDRTRAMRWSVQSVQSLQSFAESLSNPRTRESVESDASESVRDGKETRRNSANSAEPPAYFPESAPTLTSNAADDSTPTDAPANDGPSDPSGESAPFDVTVLQEQPDGTQVMIHDGRKGGR